MLSNIYEIIAVFCLAHPFIIIYLAGSIVSVGLVYSLTSGNYMDSSTRRYIMAIVCSWLVVALFLGGFLVGFLKVFGRSNNNDD